MEVLGNGFKANFWIGVEEEPDIDRFVDEQIMIDMDRFMLVGTLEKVSTCKKKNEEKEYEYFKQITVQVNNICSAADNNVNIAIPAKKEEFLYDVKFRYAPEPQQMEGDDMEPAEAEEADDKAKLAFVEEALDADADVTTNVHNVQDADATAADTTPEDEFEFEATADDAKENLIEDDAKETPEIYSKDDAEEKLAEVYRPKQSDLVVTITKPGKPLVEVLDTEADADINLEPDDGLDEPDPADDLQPDVNEPDDDEGDGIDWGD
jgi:hypothetical protein